MITMLLERLTHARGEESAFTTAELLGNAALGVASLALIWLAIRQQVLPGVITWINQQIKQ